MTFFVTFQSVFLIIIQKNIPLKHCPSLPKHTYLHWYFCHKIKVATKHMLFYFKCLPFKMSVTHFCIQMMCLKINCEWMFFCFSFHFFNKYFCPFSKEGVPWVCRLVDLRWILNGCMQKKRHLILSQNSYHDFAVYSFFIRPLKIIPRWRRISKKNRLNSDHPNCHEISHQRYLNLIIKCIITYVLYTIRHTSKFIGLPKNIK